MEASVDSLPVSPLVVQHRLQIIITGIAFPIARMTDCQGSHHMTPSQRLAPVLSFPSPGNESCRKSIPSSDHIHHSRHWESGDVSHKIASVIHLSLTVIFDNNGPR